MLSVACPTFVFSFNHHYSTTLSLHRSKTPWLHRLARSQIFHPTSLYSEPPTPFAPVSTTWHIREKCYCVTPIHFLSTVKTTIKERKIMARITVEDCLEKVNNRFSIIHMAAKRVRQLDRGSVRLVDCKNQNGVTALREVAAGKVTIKDEKAKKKWLCIPARTFITQEHTRLDW